MNTLLNAVRHGPYRRFVPLYTLVGILVLLSFVTRLILLARPDTAVPLTLSTLTHIFGMGIFFDLVAASYFCLPLALYLGLLPNRVSGWKAHRWLFSGLLLATIYFLCVLAVAEWVFWDEFAARFNFIAVDYLIYTNEVLGNIWESYPVGKWLLLLVIPSALIWLPLIKPVSHALAHPSHWKARLQGVAPWAVATALSFIFVSADLKSLSSSDAANELAGNGIYEFFAANRNNELDFERFYASLPQEQAAKTVHALSSRPGEKWLNDKADSIQRAIFMDGPEKRFNVVLISMESLGAEFLGLFGNNKGLTPNLDALASESLYFTDVFATGNRTVRGLEALALAIPPTPGQSIVKRPKNENLFTMGSLLEEKGYDAAFLYGGYGYFDNMNYFFSNNKYRVVDRTILTKEEIHYENIWGVADEDLFTLALREMDQSHNQSSGKKPFFIHIMTTSNHRPYTYPAGRIDIPSGSGRDGAVKYTDYAVGEFLRQAKNKPWFANTIFVVTADHGASARGTSHIPLEKYRIPLFIYAPNQIKPQRIDRLMSQIDIAPTVLGILNMSYVSKFYGHDIMRTAPEEDRAFVANYQTLGYMKAGKLVTLQPHRKVTITSLPDGLVKTAAPVPIADDTLRNEAISFYQNASYVFKHGLYLDEDRNTKPINYTDFKHSVSKHELAQH